ncbi:MAG: sulfatase [Halobacteriales archaeon]
MPDAPNILLVLTDQQRHDWVGSDPDIPVRTPNLDALGERGVRFTNALCPAPLCAPSRSCLASGLAYDRCGAWTNQDYPGDRPTLYERLRDDAGYETIGVGDIDLHMDSATWGLDGKYALNSMGFTDGIEIPGKRAMVGTYRNALGETGHVDVGGDSDLPPDVDPGEDEPANAYMAHLRERGLLSAYVEDMEDRLYGDRPVSNFATTRPAPLPADAYVDNWVGRHALAFLENAPEDRPWHLAVNFVGPHEPMDVTEEMHGWYRDPDVEFPGPIRPPEGADCGDLDAETHQEIRRNYAAMCENVDRWLGRYLDVLEERGEREETLVVFASDHGELLGDYGGWAKSSPRQASVGVPLTIAGPDVEPRGRIDEPASVLDLHATFLEYAGVDPGDVDSQSLRPYLEGRAESHREVVRSGLDPWRLAFDGRYKLIVGYDDDHDPLTGEVTGAFDPGDDRARARAQVHETTDPILFDLVEDPAESEDVAGEHPDVVDRLRAHLAVEG